jgi:uncharacterized protein YeaC (DUF1315 family)
MLPILSYFNGCGKYLNNKLTNNCLQLVLALESIFNWGKEGMTKESMTSCRNKCKQTIRYRCPER